MTLATKLDPILEPLMAAVRHAEERFGPDDDWVEDSRRILFQAAQRHLGHLHTFVYEKGTRDYVTTVNMTPDAFEALIMPPYDRNLASARKYREHHDGGRQWACGSFVIDGIRGDHGYTEQHHVYIFEAPDGRTDVYAHLETSATEGAEHLTDTHQEHGEPHTLFGILDRAGIEYGQRKSLVE